MTVQLPQPNFSWLNQLGNTLGQAVTKPGSNGYFPPAPNSTAAMTTAQPTQQSTGSFLQQLINKMPANQAASNQWQPNMRIGG